MCLRSHARICRAYASASHAANHDDNENSNAWFSYFLCARDSYGGHSVAPRSLGSSAMKLYMNFQLQNWQCGNLKCIIDFLENKSIFSQIKYAVILFHGKAYIWSEYKRNPFSNTCRVLSDRVGDIGSKVSISSTNYIQNVTLLYFCLDCLNVQWRP